MSPRQLRGMTVLLITAAAIGYVMAAAAAPVAGLPSPGLLAAASPKDGGDPADAKDVDTATLVISTVLVPGHGKETIEFRRGDTLVQATVHNYHNVPTRQRSIRGSFYPVYMVMTGKTHREPMAFQTVQSILKALEPEGIRIAEDKTMAKKNPDDESEPRVRVLKLKYGGR